MKKLKVWWSADPISFFHFGLFLVAIIAMWFHDGFGHIEILSACVAAAAVFAWQALAHWWLLRDFPEMGDETMKVPAVFAALSLLILVLVTLAFDPGEVGLYLQLFIYATVLTIVSVWIAVGAQQLIFGALSRRVESPQGSKDDVGLEIDDRGVSLRRRGERRAVLWEELVEVGVLTKSMGPFVEDFFYVLVDRREEVLSIPLGSAGDLLSWLQRLPGFENEAVIMASGCTEDSFFVAWQGTPGDGRLFEPPGSC